MEDTDEFSSASAQLLKHHGTYQQDNRDERATARAAGESGKRMTLMVRTRVPGGQLTGAQLLAELDLCDRFGNGTLRVTSRQALQLHGVLKADLREVIRQINAVQLTDAGGVWRRQSQRDVLSSSASIAVAWRDAAVGAATGRAFRAAHRRVPRHLAARSGDRREAVSRRGRGGSEEEPIYGRTYLPRKFKMGIALPDDNCIDVYTHDLGLLAIVEQDRVVGYNVLVGGGMGVTPSNKKTYPALGKRLAFVEPRDGVGRWRRRS